MWRTALFASAFAILAQTPALADADCSHVPPEVTSFIQKQDPDDHWYMLTEDDLIADQQILWDQDHADECPGLALVNLSGTTPLYAVAILQRPAPGYIYERLALIDPHGTVKELAGPEEMDFPSVLYRLPPGMIFDTKTKKNIPVAHDALVYEHMDSLIKTFYLDGGKMRLLQR